MENQTNNKSNVIFFVIFFLLIFASIAVTFNKFVIKKDYQIIAEVSCNPQVERCFVYECDSEIEECTGNPEEDVSYYKYVSKNAGTIYSCERTRQKIGCNEELSCLRGEAKCFYTYCDSNNLQEGEKCIR